MTISPKVGMWLSIVLAIISYLAGAGSLLTTIFGEHTTVILLACMTLVLGAGNTVNAVLHMIPSASGPVAAAQFPLGPSAPAASPVGKIAALLAILILGTLIVPTPGYAQNNKLPTFTGNPIRDIAAARAAANPATASNKSGCDLTMFTGGNGDLLSIVVKIQQCESADVGKGAMALLPDWQGALDSATATKDDTAVHCLTPAVAIIKAASGTVTTPAVAAIPAVPANPNATPPTLEVPAVPAVPEVRQYPGPVTMLQKIREFALAGGLNACKSVLTTTAAMMAPIQ